MSDINENLAIYCQGKLFPHNDDYSYDYDENEHFLTNSTYIELATLPLNNAEFISDLYEDNFERFLKRLQHTKTQQIDELQLVDLFIYSDTETEKHPYVQALLDKGASTLNSADYFEQPLTNAIKNNDQELALLLLEYGALPNIPDSDGYSALILATKKGYEKLIIKLLEAGANVHGQFLIQKPSYTPIMVAAEANKLSIAKILLKNGASVSSTHPSILGNYYEPLTVAAQSGNAEIASLFINKGATLPSDRLELVKAIIRGGSSELFQRLLTAGFKLPESKDEVILDTLTKRISEHRQHEELMLPCDCTAILQLLIDNGLNLDYEKNSRWDLVKNSFSNYSYSRLFKSDDNLKKQRIGKELQSFSELMFTEALTTGLAINHQDDRGNSLLMEAADLGFSDMVALLLKHGAHPSLLNEHEQTALDIAQRKAKRYFKRKSTKEILKVDYLKTIKLLGGETDLKM